MNNLIKITIVVLIKQEKLVTRVVFMVNRVSRKKLYLVFGVIVYHIVVSIAATEAISINDKC